MQKEIFISIFNQSIRFISDEWKDKNSKLLNEEHWSVIAKRIFSYIFENTINHNPFPVFEEEIIFEYPNHYQHFEKLNYILANAKETRKEA